MRVNGEPAEPGCYAEGHRGQYAIDHLAEIAEGFGLNVTSFDDPRIWREIAEGNMASTVRPDVAWDYHVQAGDRLEELLNAHTEGGYWEWVDGEFFLTQTEVERIVYVAVDDGEDYDDAWRQLVEGDADLVTHYDDLDHGQKAYTFRITVHYEPDEQPEEWTANEIARGLDN